MSALRGRLEALERAQREQTVALVLAWWRSLTVEECALVLAASVALDTGREPPPGAAEIHERGREELEPPLRAAIGWHEGMGGDEETERVGRLIEAADLFGGRGEAVKRRYMELAGTEE